MLVDALQQVVIRDYGGEQLVRVTVEDAISDELAVQWVALGDERQDHAADAPSQARVKWHVVPGRDSVEVRADGHAVGVRVDGYAVGVRADGYAVGV